MSNAQNVVILINKQGREILKDISVSVVAKKDHQIQGVV
jgi:hypothetical protein